MIKFRATKGDRTILGFGLSRGNVERLWKGWPIHVFLDEMGLAKTDLLILFGETEEAIVEDLKKAGLIEDTTVVRVDPKLRS